MAIRRNTQLTGAVGEFLVAAELCRRNVLATPFAGNVPHYDIIASGQSGRHIAVQVKAINALNWQFDIRKFADVQLAEDGKHQVVGQCRPAPFQGLMCVLVALKNTSQDCDHFFVLEWKELQDILVNVHKTYLSKHGGIRPKKPDSFHISLSINDVKPFKDQWHKILDRIQLTSSTHI